MLVRLRRRSGRSYGRPMRRLTVAVVAAWLGITAAAGAQTTSSATSGTPGKRTRLHFDVDSTLAPVSGRIPKGLAFTAPAGYTVDLGAVAKRCKSIQATLNECPAKSKFGSGTLVIQVTQPDQVRDVQVPLSFYLKSTKDVFAVAFLAGTRVIPGTIATTSGMVLTFDPLPDPPQFPNVTYLLKRVTIDIGASRKVTTRSGRHKRGKARKRVRSFLTNPKTCSSAGSWATSVTFTYPDGTSNDLAAPVACKG